MVILKPLARHQRLALRAMVPIIRPHLIATDMNVFAGEQPHRLRQHILQKSQRLRIAGAENIAAIRRKLRQRRRGKLKEVTDKPRLATAAQFRIRRQRRLRVAGDFDLRHNRDMPHRRVRDHFTDVVLRVKSAIDAVVIQVTGLLAPRANAGEPGIFFDRQPPALVVHQMPVEDIELLHGHAIKIALDKFFALKMPRNVQHHAAPGKARPVFNPHARRLPGHFRHDVRGINFRRQQLQERLHAVKQPRRLRRPDNHRRRGDRQLVAFRAQRCFCAVGRQEDCVLNRRARMNISNRQRITGGGVQLFTKILARRAGHRIREDARLWLKLERTCLQLQLLRGGNQRGRKVAGGKCRQSQQQGGKDNNGGFHV